MREYSKEEMICYIERFIRAYEGTSIGETIQNMFENAGGAAADTDTLSDILEQCDAGQQ